jgi:hypothetical protein
VTIYTSVNHHLHIFPGGLVAQAQKIVTAYVCPWGYTAQALKSYDGYDHHIMQEWLRHRAAVDVWRFNTRLYVELDNVKEAIRVKSEVISQHGLSSASQPAGEPLTLTEIRTGTSQAYCCMSLLSMYASTYVRAWYQLSSLSVTFVCNEEQ